MTAFSTLLVYFFSTITLGILFTAIFGPWLAFAFKGLEIARKKPFFGLLCRQILRLNLWFAALFSVSVLALFFQGYFNLKKSMPPAEYLAGAVEAGITLPPSTGEMAILSSLFAGFVFILALAHFSWQNLRQRPAAQAALLLLGAACGAAALLFALIMAAGYPKIIPTYYYLAIFTWTEAMYPLGTPTMLSSVLMITKILSGALGVAAAMCMCGMILFRKRDDFGRDYYNFAFRHMSRWGVACTVVTMLAGLGMMLILYNISSEAAKLGMLAASAQINIKEVALPTLIYASCAVFWVSLMRSLTPLRHKAGVWLSLAALLVAMLGHLMLTSNFFIAIGMMPGILLK